MLNLFPHSFGSLLIAFLLSRKSRKYSKFDQQFINSETPKLLANGIIEPSQSPWRAQVKDGDSKRRMLIDYLQTINKFTLLDAYPPPNIDQFVNNLAQYQYFSAADLKSVYYQIPLNRTARPYTAFESGDKLYQFCCLPFGVTNGTASFQRTMDEFVTKHNLKDTFAC